MKVKNFPSFCHRCLLTLETAFGYFFVFLAFFFWGGGGGGGGVLITFAQCNTRNFADMSNLLDNPSVKYLFLIPYFYSILGGGL